MTAVREVLERLRRKAAAAALAEPAPSGTEEGDDYCGECHQGWRRTEAGAAPCPCRRRVILRRRQREIDAMLDRYRAGVGSRLRAVTPFTFRVRPGQGHVKPALDRYLDELRERSGRRLTGTGWLIFGPPGVGKSYAAAYLANRVKAEAFATAAMVNFPRFLSALRATFRNEADHQGLLRLLFETDLVAFDDLGMERKVRPDEEPATSWSVEKFYEVIDRRYDDERPTIVTTNRDLDEIRERFGEAIYSRLRGMTVLLDLTGEDARRERD